MCHRGVVSDSTGWEATVERLTWFIEFALGVPEPSYAGSPDAFDGVTAPEALRALHAFAANWPCEHNGQTWPLFGGYWPQNQLLTPDMWRTEEGFTIFASENQGVCSWAFRADEADQPSPTVYCDIEGWEHSTEEPMAEFLLAWCMFEVNTRLWLHGPARVLRLVETMTPMLKTQSPTFGMLELYENKVLLFQHRGSTTATVVGTEDLAVVLGDAAEPYRQVTVQFTHEKTRWRIVVDELGGGNVHVKYRNFDVRDLVPADFFDELYDSQLSAELREANRAHATAAEPKAEMVREWSHTIRQQGYLADGMTGRLFSYLSGHDELAPLIKKHSPFAPDPTRLEIFGTNIERELGNNDGIERVYVAGNASVTLLGSVAKLELEALQGSTVDAANLEVNELVVLLEMCTVEATKAKKLSGYVAYGSTISVSETANIDDLQTANAGRIDRR